MRFKLEIERTFAGKQYENLKPRIVLEYNDGEEADLKKASKKAVNILEELGAEWKEKQLGKSQGEQTS